MNQPVPKGMTSTLAATARTARHAIRRNVRFLAEVGQERLCPAIPLPRARLVATLAMLSITQRPLSGRAAHQLGPHIDARGGSAFLEGIPGCRIWIRSGALAWLAVSIDLELAYTEVFVRHAELSKDSPRYLRRAGLSAMFALQAVGRFDLATRVSRASKQAMDRVMKRPPGLRNEPLYFAAVGHVALAVTLGKAIRLGMVDGANVELLRRAGDSGNELFADLVQAELEDSGVIVRDISAEIRPWKEPDIELWPGGDGRYLCGRVDRAAVCREWRHRGLPPLLRCPDVARVQAQGILSTLGLEQPSPWVVGVHLRRPTGGGYTTADTPMAALLQALDLILEEGGVPVLLGATPMGEESRIPDGVIDARHLTGEARMCVNAYVWSASAFFVGNQSGGTEPPTTFGTRTLWVDAHPTVSWRPAEQDDMYVPKMIYWVEEKRILSAAESIHPRHSRSQSLSLPMLEGSGYRLVPNDAAVARGAVADMISRMRGEDVAFGPLDERFDEIMGAVGLGIGARIAPSFLRRWASVWLPG